MRILIDRAIIRYCSGAGFEDLRRTKIVPKVCEYGFPRAIARLVAYLLGDSA